MPALSETIAALPPLQRRMAEAWLTRFEENWHDQKLRECMAALPAQSSLRRPLLLAMIERDLSHQWDAGRKMLVEDYLKDFPELGFASDLPLELIAAEFNVRQSRGGADLSEFAERFPARVDDLYVLLKPAVFEGTPQAAATNSVDAVTARRLKLLRAPAAHEPLNTAPQGRQGLPHSSIPNAASAPLPKSNTTPRAGMPPLTPTSIPDIFTKPEPIGAQPPKKQAGQAAPPSPVAAEGPRSVKRPAPAPASQPLPPAPMPPAVVGKYAIQKRLGSSGQGSNYLANDTQLGRTVVLKVPRFKGTNVEAERALFRREAKAAAGWHHPMLCPVLDLGQADGIDYLAMSYLEGDCLQDLIRQRPIWPPRAAVDIVLKMATALDVAHGLGVLHRDLKPSNVFLTAGDLPVIVGFGQWTRPVRPKESEGAVYVAPEQVTGPPDAANPQSDAYSLGAILYQLLTGQVPPIGDQKPPTIPYPPDLDAQLQDVCRKALAHYPDERYRSMTDFAKELANYRQTLSISETGTRMGLPGSSQRIPLPPSAQAVAANPVNSVAFAQMQQLRNLSGTAIPATSPMPVRRGSAPYVKWGVIALVVVIASVVTLFLLNDNANESHQTQPGANANANASTNSPPPSPVIDSIGDLLRDLRSSNVKDREIAVQKLSQRNDEETVDALAQVIVADPWPDDNGPAGDIHEAALRALIAVDADKTSIVLRRAAKSDESRTRSWAYGELAKRIVETENRSVLQPNFLAGLRDSNPQVRRAVADQIRKNKLDDPAVVQALVARVSDDVWGEPNNSPPENFIHNPKADGGKDAALDALEEIAPKRVVLEALNSAMRCGNLDVKKWAEHQKKTRELN